MNIEPLEVKLVKSSKIEDGDIVIIKIDSEDKKNFDTDNIKSLYSQIKKMLGDKNLSIYFFPKNLDIDFIKTQVENIESNKDKINNEIETPNN
ncbi:MAG: hypothetical protein RIQ48_631 [Pseudomonadota bacterium]|jgi:hypothetical protein